MTIGFNKCIPDYIIGTCIAVILLAIIMGIGCLAGGFIIQGAAEEAMCRGFLMASLQKKVSTPVAIFWSATVFAFPHFSNLFMSDFQYVLIGVINLYMISFHYWYCTEKISGLPAVCTVYGISCYTEYLG